MVVRGWTVEATCEQVWEELQRQEAFEKCSHTKKDRRDCENIMGVHSFDFGKTDFS